MTEAQSPPVKRLISRYETETKLVFKPSRAWYKTTGINRLRFGLFVRGQKHPDSEEIKVLMEFFKKFFPVKAEDML